MSDVLVDQKITQDQFNSNIAPIELDLLSFFKTIQEEMLMSFESSSERPERAIENIIRTLEDRE